MVIGHLQRAVHGLVQLTAFFVSFVVLGESNPPATAPTIGSFFHARGYEPVALVRNAANHLTTQGSLGGRKVECLVDTGCSVSEIEAPYVGNATPLESKVGVARDIFGTDIGNQKLVALETLQLGRCQFLGQPALVHSRVRFSGEDTPATGTLFARRRPGHTKLILGWDFLARNFAWVDCNRTSLYFRGSEPSAELRQSIGESLRRSGFDEVPLIETENYSAIVQGTVSGHEALLMIDTGSFATVLDEAAAKALGLFANNTHARLVGATGSTGTLDWTSVGDFKLGAHPIAKSNMGLVDLRETNANRKKAGLRPLIGFIGGDLLAHEEALIDVVGGRIFFRSTK